jgi:hypothetical protein
VEGDIESCLRHQIQTSSYNGDWLQLVLYVLQPCDAKLDSPVVEGTDLSAEQR